MAPARRSTRALPVVVAIAALAGSACGSDKPSTSRSTASSSYTTSTLSAGGSQTGLNSSSLGGGFGLGPPTSINCVPVPRSVGPLPGWLPSDLPLPPGTILVNQPGDVAGYHRALFATVALRDFVRFALAEWPSKGWTLGRGDAENGEAEDSFGKSGVGGAFRVRGAYCDPGRSELLVVFGSTTSPSTSPATTTAG